jgi:hypothetical protein
MLELLPINYFSLEEFLIVAKGPVPNDVLNKIVRYHWLVLNDIRTKLGIPIRISANSCYRPRQYEIKQGRSGKSEHTFSDDSWGAVDLTCADMNKLFNLLKSDSPYRRICVYKEKNFVHCDYKGNEKKLFINTPNGWKEM